MTPEWHHVVKWATREIETARDALERAQPADVPALQARVTGMRDLLRLPDHPNRDPEKQVGEPSLYA